VTARAGGKDRRFEVKTLGPARWRAAGGMDLRLVVVRPLGYRLRKGSRKLYTQPAYLICTDPDMPLEQILQEYIWRWGIEVNHRDEKTLLGVGQAQVRNENSAASVPAAAVAAFAMLHLAAIKAYGQGGGPAAIPPAKWRDPKKKKRPSTQDLINELRRELWAKAIRPEVLDHYVSKTREARSRLNANRTYAAPYSPLPHDQLETKLQGGASAPRAGGGDAGLWGD